jgi:hypothetical protein
MLKLKSNKYIRVFLCANILVILRCDFEFKFKNYDCNSRYITPYISIFSRKNATIACNELGIKPPYGAACGGWWDNGDVETRIKVLEWMINKLKSNE